MISSKQTIEKTQPIFVATSRVNPPSILTGI